MKLFVGAAITALFLATIVTELFTRIFPGSYLGLLIACTLAIGFGSIVITAIDRRGRAQAVPAQAGGRPAERGRQSRQRGDTQKRSGRRDSSSAKPASRDAAKPVQRGGATDQAPAAGGGGPRETGHVKWFNRTKGFGFIVRDNGGEIFVHYKSIQDPGRRSLRDGQRVTFEVAEHDKGLQAEAVATEPGQDESDEPREASG